MQCVFCQVAESSPQRMASRLVGCTQAVCTSKTILLSARPRLLGPGAVDLAADAPAVSRPRESSGELPHNARACGFSKADCTLAWLRGRKVLAPGQCIYHLNLSIYSRIWI
jgi:hypothetical protein|eukprot:COSAG06_NODE_1874_length_8165_cov_3.101314_7_plen_111_part_00